MYLFLFLLVNSAKVVICEQIIASVIGCTIGVSSWANALFSAIKWFFLVCETIRFAAGVHHAHNFAHSIENVKKLNEKLMESLNSQDHVIVTRRDTGATEMCTHLSAVTIIFGNYGFAHTPTSWKNLLKNSIGNYYDNSTRPRLIQLEVMPLESLIDITDEAIRIHVWFLESLPIRNTPVIEVVVSDYVPDVVVTHPLLYDGPGVTLTVTAVPLPHSASACQCPHTTVHIV